MSGPHADLPAAAVDAAAQQFATGQPGRWTVRSEGARDAARQHVRPILAAARPYFRTPGPDQMVAAIRAEHQPRWFDTSAGRWRTGGVPDPHARATCAACTGQDYPCRTLQALPVEPALGAAADQHSGTVNGG